MLRKLIARLFFGAVLLSTFTAMIFAICVWMATMQPAFYAELAANRSADQNQKWEAAISTFTETAQLVEQLQEMPADQRGQSMAAWKPQLQQNLQSLTDQGLLDQDGNLLLSQQQINSAVAGGKNSGGPSFGDLQELRVALKENLLQIGAQIPTKEYGDYYVSLCLRPSLNEQSELKLEILSGSLGRLPLPIGWFLKHLPEDILQPSDQIEWHTDVDPPYVVLSQPEHQKSLHKVKQIRCMEGQLKLELTHPIKLPE